MKKGIPKIESRRGAGKCTGVTSEEKMTWIEKWPDVRKGVTSNDEAYKVLSGVGLRYRDHRTIKSHLECILPLVNEAPLSALLDLVDDFESRMPAKEFMLLVRERFPIEELGPKFVTLADVLIKEAPQPAQVIKALGSILAGGFPLDTTSVRK